MQPRLVRAGLAVDTLQHENLDAKPAPTDLRI